MATKRQLKKWATLGGYARSLQMSQEERRDLAKRASKARWAKKRRMELEEAAAEALEAEGGSR